MDRFELSERRYMELVHDSLLRTSKGQRYWKVPVGELVAWLEVDVVAAIEQIWERPSFRQHATWPQCHLVSGADSVERRCIEAVDRALVMEARELLRLTKLRAVERQLVGQGCLERVVKYEEVSISADGIETTKREWDTVDVQPMLRAQVEAIAERDWYDLVCLNDYLQPFGGMMERTPTATTDVNFLVDYNPRLSHVGDFVTRCMMERVDQFSQSLDKFRRYCYRALGNRGRQPRKALARERAAWEALADRRRVLVQTCQSRDEFHLQNACAAVAQVCVEFGRTDDIGWLGISDAAMKRAHGHLRRVVTNQRELDATDRISAAIGEMKQLYLSMPKEQTKFEAAVATGGLVLQKSPAAAYWKGSSLTQQLSTKPKAWLLLCKLATAAQHGGEVGEADIYESRDSGPHAASTFPMLLSRLAAILPEDLGALIEHGLQERMYRLKLAPERVHLFGFRYRYHD